MRLHRWLGIDVRFTGDPDRSSVDAGIEAVAAELRAAGRRPYPVPRGGATPLGALGYVRASVELAAQLDALGERPSALWLADRVVRHAGRPGARAPRWPARRTRSSGVTVSRPVAEMPRRGSRAGRRARPRWPGIARRPLVAPARARTAGSGPGTALPSAEGRPAARLVAVTEGVFLDPVFGAKAMAALIADCRSGRARGTAGVPGQRRRADAVRRRGRPGRGQAP